MNKKGFIFTLDVILGLVVIFGIIGTSIFFVSQGSQVSISEHQLLLVGSDIVNIMEEDGTLHSLDHNTIEYRMEEILPTNYEMLLRIEGNFQTGNGTLEVGGEIPEKRLIIAGQRISLTENNTYLKITHYTWGRKQ